MALLSIRILVCLNDGRIRKTSLIRGPPNILPSSLLVLELWRQLGLFLETGDGWAQDRKLFGASSEHAEPQMGLEEQASVEYSSCTQDLCSTFHLFSKHSPSVYCVLESELGTHMTKINHISFLPAGYPPLRNWVKQTDSDNEVRNGIMGMLRNHTLPRLRASVKTSWRRWHLNLVLKMSEGGSGQGRKHSLGRGVAGWDKSKSPS